jgi:hypothetical protein
MGVALEKVQGSARGGRPLTQIVIPRNDEEFLFSEKTEFISLQ